MNLWLRAIAEEGRVAFQFLLSCFALVSGNESDFRIVAMGDEVFPELRRHGFSSLHAPNGLWGDLWTSVINSRTRLRRASIDSTSWASFSSSTHSAGTSAAISRSVSASNDSIRLSQGSNDCHPHTP